ncbi:MAG: hypothetical protein AAB433_20290, partial [Nitrospirota bacterium]
ALVGRAQWKINQPPSLKRARASLEGSIKWMMLVRRAQSRIDQATLENKMGIRKMCALRTIPAAP